MRGPARGSPVIRSRRSPLGPGERADDGGRTGGLTGVDDPVLGDRALDRQVEEDPAAAEDEEVVARLLDVGDDMRGQERGDAVGPDGIDEDVQELAACERVETGEGSSSRRTGARVPSASASPTCACCPPDSSSAGAVAGMSSSSSRRRASSASKPSRSDAAITTCSSTVSSRYRDGICGTYPMRRTAPDAVPGGVDAVDGEAALGRPLEPDPGLEQRGLARPVRADERGDAAVGDLEVDVSQGPRPPTL